VDSGNNRIALTLSSSFIGTSGSSGTTLGQFQGPMNLCVSSRGIYVGETANNRVQIFDPIIDGHGKSSTPFITRLALSTQLGLSQPHAIASIADFLAEKIYIADTGNNRVIKVMLPETGVPETVWNAMKASIVTGNIDAAIMQFTSPSSSSYRQALLSIGLSKANSDLNVTGTLIPVFIGNNTAQYYFEKTIGGQNILFTVDFAKENGVWKIFEF
jgi:hypothetical protein